MTGRGKAEMAVIHRPGVARWGFAAAGLWEAQASSQQIVQERVDLGTEKSLKHVEFGSGDGKWAREVIHDLRRLRLASRRASAFALPGQHGGLVGAEGGSPTCDRCSGGRGLQRCLGAGYRTRCHPCRPRCTRGARRRRSGGVVRHEAREVPRRPTAYASGAGCRPAWGSFFTFPARQTRPREKAREPPCTTKFQGFWSERKRHRSAKIAEAGPN